MYSFINDTIGCSDCKYYESNCQTCQNQTTCSLCSSGYMLDDTTKKCLKCHSTCSEVCSNCRCINDTMYNLINEVIGCRDCRYAVGYCQKCLDKRICSKCDTGYLLDVTSNSCEECHETCEVCKDCDCSNDIMYNFVNKYEGCRDCTLIVPNCKNCTNKS